MPILPPFLRRETIFVTSCLLIRFTLREDQILSRRVDHHLEGKKKIIKENPPFATPRPRQCIHTLINMQIYIVGFICINVSRLFK